MINRILRLESDDFGKRRPHIAMFTQLQLAPIPSEGDGKLDISSIGRTNRYHSEEEHLYIRNVLLVAESLSQSGSVLDGDLGRREETMDLIRRCKIALAPHKRLPPDILRSIFHFCGGTSVKFPLASRPGGIGQDLRLLCITHVCSAWRQLALEMPALWGDISIYLTGREHSKTLSSAKYWFDRAQDMRRALFIDFDVGAFSPHLHDSWEQVLEFMAQYRLEELELMYPINHVALKLPDHVWPSIERLHLRPEEDRSSPGHGQQQLFSNFGKLSNLRHLKIYGSYHLNGMDRIIPWHQLRTFEVGALLEGPVTPSTCLNVLRQSQLLEHCRITLSKEESLFTSSTKEKIILDNMDHFEARFRDGLAVSSFLQPLVMSNITTFTLKRAVTSAIFHELSCDMPALIGIIKRSGGMRRIRRLEIDTSYPVLDVGILLELLPSLDTICIQSGRLSDNSIRRLSSGKLGPRLCNISLDVLHDADQILSMVESRYQNSTQSPDSEQIEDKPCPFKSISIACMATTEKRLCRNRIELLSEKCDVSMRLGIGEDSDSTDDE